MSQLERPASDQTPPPERPERWDQAIVAGYLYGLLRPSV